MGSLLPRKGEGGRWRGRKRKSHARQLQVSEGILMAGPRALRRETSVRVCDPRKASSTPPISLLALTGASQCHMSPWLRLIRLTHNRDFMFKSRLLACRGPQRGHPCRPDVGAAAVESLSSSSFNLASSSTATWQSRPMSV